MADTIGAASPPAGRASLVFFSRRPWLAALPALCALGLALYLARRSYDVDIDVYLVGGQHALQPDLYAVQFALPYLKFTYPPFAAILFWPLSHLLGIFWAQTLWAVVNVGALYGLIAVSIGVTRPSLNRSTVRVWSLLALLPAMLLNPVFLTVGLGQINLLICLGIVWDLTRVRKTRSLWPVGITTGIAAAVKLTPLIFIPYLLLSGRRKAAMNAAAAFIACSGLTYVVTPSTSKAFWTHYAFDSHRAGALLYSSDQNLMSALSRFEHLQLSVSTMMPVLLAIAVIGVILSSRAYHRETPMFSVLVCAGVGLVVSPITWAHHFIWVVPLIVWLALSADRPRSGPRWAFGVAGLFWAAPIWWVPTSWRPSAQPVELAQSGWRLLAGNSFFLATALFIVWAALSTLRRVASTAPTASERSLVSNEHD